MTAPVWRLATKSDRTLIQRFQCTEKPSLPVIGRRPFHPREWECETQRWIRREAYRQLEAPPLDRRTILAVVDGSAAAVACHERHADLSARLGTPVRMLMATGIAFHLRRQGGQLADQMHARVVRDARAREGGPVLLIAGVHESNEASKRALGRAGMVRQPTLEETLRASVDLAGHEVWLVAID